MIKRVEKCTHKRVKVGKHRWRVKTVCHPPRIKLLKTKRVGFGRAVKIGGIAATAQGVPLGGQPVEILTAPNNGLGQWTLAASVTTNADGGWQARLRAGPSRLIRAVYPGSPTVLPATGRATLNVPPRIVVAIGPRRLPWARDADDPRASRRRVHPVRRRRAASAGALPRQPPGQLAAWRCARTRAVRS